MNFKYIIIFFVSSLLYQCGELVADKPSQKTYKKAVFAGGCFWCMEPPFDDLPGVISTTTGYTGGSKQNPSYEEVSTGTTGHAEALEIEYDPAIVSYEKLLEVFWKNIDPTAKNAQFCDHGNQYRSAIFFSDEKEKQLAENSKIKIAKIIQPVETEIVQLKKFYPAEEYHQDYYKKNPVRYKYYRYACGRDKRLKEIWK
jgi:peptide-methionine (S)-S-oxide reductase